jgi:hypothetical protein
MPATAIMEMAGIKATSVPPKAAIPSRRDPAKPGETTMSGRMGEMTGKMRVRTRWKAQNASSNNGFDQIENFIGYRGPLCRWFLLRNILCSKW